MFKPARMVRLDCIVARDKRKALSRGLQEAGVTEVEFLPNDYLEGEGITRSNPEAQVSEISELILTANKLIDFFAPYSRQTTGFVEDVLGIEKIEATLMKRMPPEKLITESRTLLSELDGDVAAASKRNNETEKRMNEAYATEESLSHFKELNPKVEWIGASDFLYTQAGVTTEQGFEDLRKALATELGDGFGLESAEDPDGGVAFLAYTAKSNTEALDRILRKTNCERKTLQGAGRVQDLLDRIQTETKALAKEKEAHAEKMQALCAKVQRRILETRELLLVEKAKCEVYIRCGRTDKTEVMRLWTPAKKKAGVIALINDCTGGMCAIEVEDELEEAPILLENPPVLRSFEVLTRLFSPPRYREVDPTPFIAPTFALFFGFMLTDAVYGIVLAAAAFLIARKYGRYSQALYDLCVIMIACGMGAIVFGFITGSFLGDFVGKYVLGGSGSQDVALWLDPMYGRNAVTFLALVAAVGVAHLFAGYLIGLYYALKDGRIRDALLSYGSWFILAGGVALLALAGYGKIPSDANYVGYALLIAGLVLSLMRSSLMALMEITGFVGNALSYARLLALALTTSGIAMTFNFLASISLKVPYVGIILAALVFIFGHVMNILINTLGGFVHSLRLHYLEFFGTFYAGGGREFTPFKEERKYTTTR